MKIESKHDEEVEDKKMRKCLPHELHEAQFVKNALLTDKAHPPFNFRGCSSGTNLTQDAQGDDTY